MAVPKKVASKTLPAFSAQVQETAKQWSPESFVLAFLGQDNLNALKDGARLSFPAFEMWMEGADTFMRHADRDGRSGPTIQVNSRNAERLYFAACVDNHLLAQWPHMTYEQDDGAGGRADAVVWSGKAGKTGKALVIYENKQARVGSSDRPVGGQRTEALHQAISRLERMWSDPQTRSKCLGKTIALSICLFDKESLTLSSAGEYYNNHAKTLGFTEDRLALAERSLRSSGMWVESWIVDVKSLMELPRDRRYAWLIDKVGSSTSSPMIPVAAKKGSRVAVAGLDELVAKNRVVYSRMSQMMNYPFLNPAGFSDAQNTRDLMEGKARRLTPSMMQSVLSNLLAWKRAEGIQSGGIKDESYSTLGSNDRELHLVDSSCFEAQEASGDYETVWVCGDVGFANGQHSTLAFKMIQEALAKADRSSPEAFKMSLLGADALSGAKKEQRDKIEAALDEALGPRNSTPDEVKYFFDNVIVQTSVKWARDDRHSWRLSFESNNAVAQDAEDLLIHENREQIKQALSTLSVHCAAQRRSNPLVMAKNHQSGLAQSMSRNDALVPLPDATQWLAADAMFMAKRWGPHNKWRGQGSKAASSAKAKMELSEIISGRVSIGIEESDQMAADLLGYQNIYRAIFSSTKGEREAVYKDMKKTLMAGDGLASEIGEEFKDFKEMLGLISEQKGAPSQEEVDVVLEFCQSFNKLLTQGVDYDWVDTRRAKRIELTLDENHELFAQGKMTRDGLLQVLTSQVKDAVDQINERGSSPAMLHAAAICAMAMAEFKKETCEAQRASSAQKDSAGKKTGSKLTKFSEVLSQDKYSFWAKEASFDMLVAASLARAHGSVLAREDYKIEPESPGAWPERLAGRVKMAAANALKKIEWMTAMVHQKDSSLVSHCFRNLHGAQRLMNDENQGVRELCAALEQAGAPAGVLGFNYYEWMMNAGVPASMGVPIAEDAAPVDWLDAPARASRQKRPRSSRRARP